MCANSKSRRGIGMLLDPNVPHHATDLRLVITLTVSYTRGPCQNI